MRGSSPRMTVERAMHKKIKYAAGEIGRVRVVEDFLPPPVVCTVELFGHPCVVSRHITRKSRAIGVSDG